MNFNCVQQPAQPGRQVTRKQAKTDQASDQIAHACIQSLSIFLYYFIHSFFVVVVVLSIIFPSFLIAILTGLAIFEKLATQALQL